MSYDPETGAFIRLVDTGTNGRHKAGPARGTVNRHHGYALIGVDGIQYRAHRLAWFWMNGKWPDQVDLINGIRTDNRWANLREANYLLNVQNARRARKSSSTGLLGVSPNRERWMAQIRANGQHLHLGTFDTPELAHAAYLDAKRRLHPGCTI